ncbi:hypothetical protein [Mycobacterium sp.]|uniref:hypothetical protein n=1 Tax=Mycobacterium sp. TaxID=1785 RepID=UPI003BB0C909
MATHAHDPGNSLSASKQGGIAVAVITTVGGIIVAGLNQIGVFDKGSPPPMEPTPTTISNPPQQTSPMGSMDKVEINAAGTEVTVTGSARKDVDSVAVMVGPRQSGGQYWASQASVFNQQWRVEVATDPRLPQPYTIDTRYHSVSGGAASESAFKFTFFQGTGATTTTPPPTNQIVNCAEQNGPNCFNGPGWGGPPSVYQSSE